MKNFRDFFATRRRSTGSMEDHIDSVEPSQLTNLNKKELIDIINRYDMQAEYLKSELSKEKISNLQTVTAKNELEDQLKFFREANQILSVELYNKGKDTNSEVSKNQHVESSLTSRNVKNSSKADAPGKLKLKKTKISALKKEILELKSENFQLKEEKNRDLKEKADLLEAICIKNSDLNDTKKENKKLELANIDIEELKKKLQHSKDNNQKLIKKVVDLKQKQDKAQEEIMNLNNKLRQNLQPLDSCFSIKKQLDYIYKEFMKEINRSMDGNSSFYSLGSSGFSKIEKALNELKSQMHEKVESEENEPRPVSYTARVFKRSSSSAGINLR